MQMTIESFDSQRSARFHLKSSGKKRTQIEDVLNVFLGCVNEGATDAEVADVLGIERSSVIARRHDIMKKFPDLLYADGKRLSKHNYPCDVWRCKT